MLPFLSIGGERALGFDIKASRLHFFGTVIWLDEFYLLLLFTLFLVFFFIALTNIMGRVWCGWICPQTMIPLVSETIVSIFPGKKRGFSRVISLFLFTGLVSISLFWLFVEPAKTLQTLMTSKTAALLLVGTWAVIFADLAFLGPKFCATICPYSMLQNVLFDENTLVIEYDRSRHPCLLCGACERVCPTGIDIKKGLQRECIACAQCIDACVEVTARKKISPFISYKGTILKRKTFWLSIAVVSSLAMLIVAAYMKPTVNLTLRERGYTDTGAAIINYEIRNNKNREISCRFRLDGNAEVLGQTRFILAPFEEFKGKMLLVTHERGESKRIKIILTAGNEKTVREVTIF